MLRKALRGVAVVVVALAVAAGAAYAVKTQLLEDEAPARAPLAVEVLAPGTFQSAHPYAPYYVVPRKRHRDPSKLSRLARNKLLTKPASALSKGAMAGSPQIVRLSLRASGDEPVTVEGVRFRVVSDARPLRGWYTTLPGCVVEPVRRARASLDRKRPRTRYVDARGRRSRALELRIEPGTARVLELHASTARRRVAWTAELALRDADDRAYSVAVDDGDEPFRVTSPRSSRGYAPVYGATGVSGFERSSDVRRRGEDCPQSRPPA